MKLIKIMQHLKEEDIAICAEALERGEFYSLSREIREHLAQCDQCAGEVLMVADIAGEVNFSLPLENKLPEKDKTQRIIAWSVSIAAAVALVLLVINTNQTDSLDTMTTDAYITQDGEEDNTSTEDRIASTEKTDDESVVADNKDDRYEGMKEDFPSAAKPDKEKRPTATAFPPSADEPADTLKFLAVVEKNEDLEKLVERFKGNMRDQNGVVVESPFNITTTDDDSVLVKWKNPEGKRLIIEVFNNKGVRIFEMETNKESYKLSDMDKGLYYWKLISSDYDLLFCGRIIVE